MIALFANNFLLPHITTVFQNKKTRKKNYVQKRLDHKHIY